MFVQKEVDKIVTQMMQAAEYRGWDVTELKPVSSYIQVTLVMYIVSKQHYREHNY